jgi:flagellar operon protein
VSVALNPALLPPGAASAPPARPAGGPPSIAGGRTAVEDARTVESGRAPGPSFADVLKDATGGTGASQSPSGPAATVGADGTLSFSKHALERVQRRGIALDPTTLGRLHEGVVRAAGKGSRDSIVLVDGTAFVVSVSNRTVITAVGSEHMRDHVFTNIDSAVIA